MKKLIIEEKTEGLLKLIGEYVTFYCESFIYAGTLTGVNDTCVLLTDASIVYDTGAHDTLEFATVEPLPNDWYLQTAKIESFGVFKNGK